MHRKSGLVTWKLQCYKYICIFNFRNILAYMSSHISHMPLAGVTYGVGVTSSAYMSLQRGSYSFFLFFFLQNVFKMVWNVKKYNVFCLWNDIYCLHVTLSSFRILATSVMVDFQHNALDHAVSYNRIASKGKCFLEWKLLMFYNIIHIKNMLPQRVSPFDHQRKCTCIFPISSKTTWASQPAKTVELHYDIMDCFVLFMFRADWITHRISTYVHLVFF